MRPAVLDRGVGLEDDVEDVAGMLCRENRLGFAAEAGDEMANAGFDNTDVIPRNLDVLQPALDTSLSLVHDALRRHRG